VLDIRRFRANIIVETPEGQEHCETNSVGGTLIFGMPKAARGFAG
jgi:hypothetical protein